LDGTRDAGEHAMRGLECVVGVQEEREAKRRADGRPKRGRGREVARKSLFLAALTLLEGSTAALLLTSRPLTHQHPPVLPRSLQVAIVLQSSAAFKSATTPWSDESLHGGRADATIDSWAGAPSHSRVFQGMGRDSSTKEGDLRRTAARASRHSFTRRRATLQDNSCSDVTQRFLLPL
jgi:hypothetical protein